VQEYAAPAVSPPTESAAPSPDVADFGSNAAVATAVAPTDPVSALLAAVETQDSSAILDCIYDLGPADVTRIQSDASLGQRIRESLSAFAAMVWDSIVGAEASPAAPASDPEPYVSNSGAVNGEEEELTEVSADAPALGASPPAAAPAPAVKSGFDELKEELDAGVPDMAKAVGLIEFLDNDQLQKIARYPGYIDFYNRMSAAQQSDVDEQMNGAFPSPSAASGLLEDDPAVAAAIDACMQAIKERVLADFADNLAQEFFSTGEAAFDNFGTGVSLNPGYDTAKSLGLGAGKISCTAATSLEMRPSKDGVSTGMMYSSVDATLAAHTTFVPTSTIPALAFQAIQRELHASTFTLRLVRDQVIGIGSIDLEAR
jgi:hypothetical protein